MLKDSFVLGSSLDSDSIQLSGIGRDRLIDLIQFLAITTIETVSTTVIAGLASGLPPGDVQRLFRFAPTAPLLPYTLHLDRREPQAVLLNIGPSHPFGIGRHHCVGASLAALIAETTLTWSMSRAVDAESDLAWHLDRLGRSLEGALTFRPRGGTH